MLNCIMRIHFWLFSYVVKLIAVNHEKSELERVVEPLAYKLTPNQSKILRQIMVENGYIMIIRARDC